jgi:hypothetical protein
MLAPACSCNRGFANEQLLLADGTAVEARLADAAADGNLAFDVGGKRLAPDGKELIRWGHFAPAGRARLVVFDGGDVLVYARCEFDGDRLHFETQLFGEVRVDANRIRGLVVQPPASVADGDRLIDAVTRWAEEPSTKGDSRIDLVTLDNGDVLEGSVAALDDAKVAIETDGGVLDLDPRRVRSIAFGRRGVDAGKKDGLRFIVGGGDGSRLTAASASLTKAGLEVVTAWGVKLTIARENVAAIQTLGGRATYLSDMTAVGYKHVPYLATAWPLAVDRNVGGARLRAGRHEFFKGLGMHSAASATYVLDKPYRRFDAELAIDDSVYDDATTGTEDRRRPRGSVVFRVYTDGGDGAWKLRHTSDTIRGGAAPTPISLDVAGAKRISLIVDFADRGDEWDRANWLDARLVE